MKNGFYPQTQSLVESIYAQHYILCTICVLFDRTCLLPKNIVHSRQKGVKNFIMVWETNALTFVCNDDLMVEGIFKDGIILGRCKIDETDLSTEYEKAQEGARLPQADEHEKRTESTCCTSFERQKSIVRLIAKTTSRGLFCCLRALCIQSGAIFV